MKPIITAKNISKKYKLRYDGAYIALRDVLVNFFKKPFSISPKERRDEFWALKNVDFTIHKGEVIGIIGNNGAGKSTLLKILSQITPPTTGEITIRGRVGSLLEVGTGFHPELTGRENIFLNGAILGMKKKEILKKFDEIVKFADIDTFLDTPVKYYSSGMYVRLAFSVAAHMDPDILIIDEVLAVGDAEFQKKCLGKMEEVTRDEGRTILFVSHNMVAIEELCQKAILLDKGTVVMTGKTRDVIDFYLQKQRANTSTNASAEIIRNRPQTKEVQFTDILITNDKNTSLINSSDRLRIQLKYTSKYAELITGARIVVTISSLISQRVVLRLDSDVTASAFSGTLPNEGSVECLTDPIGLVEGNYVVDIDFLINGASYDYVRNVAEFHVDTDIESYNHRIAPDQNTCDHVHAFTFKSLD